MASTEHKNRRRAIALERLNLAVARLASSKGLEAIEIPRKMRDKDMLQIVTFERMGEFLEALAGDSVPKLESNPIAIKQANRQAKSKRAKDVQTTPAISEVKF